jgi:hypothetical protein
MKRKEFLEHFLGALGAVEIDWLEETEDSIAGKVIYSPDDPEEYQEFHWSVHETDAPSPEVTTLAKLLKEKRLLSIDRIIIPKEKLWLLYNETYNLNLSQNSFYKLLEILEQIEVPMIDDGKETDVFIIHQ